MRCLALQELSPPLWLESNRVLSCNCCDALPVRGVMSHNAKSEHNDMKRLPRFLCQWFLNGAPPMRTTQPRSFSTSYAPFRDIGVEIWCSRERWASRTRCVACVVALHTMNKLHARTRTFSNGSEATAAAAKYRYSPNDCS